MTYPSLAYIPQTIDMVYVFRAPAAMFGIVDDMLKLDLLPKINWMQLIVCHDEAAARAEADGSRFS